MGKKFKKYERLKGIKIGMLLIVDIENYMYKSGGPYFLCKCDCGKMTVIKGRDLFTGAIHSCGCDEFFHDKDGEAIVTKLKKPKKIIKPFIQIFKPERKRIIKPFKDYIPNPSIKPPEIYEYPGKDFCVSFTKDDRSFYTFDKRDIPVVQQHSWRLNKDGYVMGHKVIYHKDESLHRAIKEAHGEDIKGKIVDHKNGQIRDNRDNNIRTCDTQQNSMNSKGFGKYEKYIDFVKNGNKFRFRIRQNGKTLVEQCFDTYEEAQAYKKQWMAEHPNEFYYDEENNLSNIEYKLPEGAPIYDAFFIADGLKPPTTIKPFYEVPNKIITPFYEVPKRIITPFVMIDQEPEDNKDSNIL